VTGIVRDAAGRRPRQTTIDPSALAVGTIALQTADIDRYFALDDDVLTLIVQALLDRLPEPERSCVRMTVMARIPYAEAGRLLGAEEEPPRAIDGKTVWRWAHRGLVLLKAQLAESPWAAEMLSGRIPLPSDQVSMSSTRGFHDVVIQPLTGGDTQ
jgi:DNA-directed RNA polymerase specialized sigma24 family protein